MENTIIVSTNFWRVPSPERAFDGWLEGSPSESEKLQVIAKAEADRAAWKPNAEAMDLVKKLNAFVGYRVKIQFWDPCMVVLNEGPSPLIADVQGVKLLEVAGVTQAYIEVSNLFAVPSDDLYSPFVYLESHDGSEHQLAPLADLYIISKLEEDHSAFE